MSFQVTKQMAQELGIQIYDWGIFILPLQKIYTNENHF
jgi:hypothetical protein